MPVLNGLLNNMSMYCLQLAVSQFAAVKHQFLLSPVSAQAHVKRNGSEKPLRSRTQPRIICDLHLEEVPLSLTDVSYECVVFKLIISY
jgi:vacuolar protein sorting-associated protein 13D